MLIKKLYEKQYPKLLNQIHDKPQKLFISGIWPPPPNPCIAIVGTRRMTLYGRKMAESITKTLVQNGITIVSGFAMGIDRIAHETAINCGGYTIAVIAGGLHHITPPINADIIEKVETHGCFISELEPDTIPQVFSFPLRNRIIAGISLATVVIEGDERSGALITGRQAFDYGREVFTVPGDITRAQSLGPLKLLQRNIATPVKNGEEILEHLDLLKKTKDKQRALPLSLSADAAHIYNLLSETDSTSPDTLAGKLGLNMPIFHILLTELEIENLVEHVPGGLIKK